MEQESLHPVNAEFAAESVLRFRLDIVHANHFIGEMAELADEIYKSAGKFVFDIFNIFGRDFDDIHRESAHIDKGRAA